MMVTLLTYITDMRKDVCYARYYRGQCVDPMLGLHYKATCCCSLGKAWGNTCEPCPSKDSDQYRELCESVYTKSCLKIVFMSIIFIIFN